MCLDYTHAKSRGFENKNQIKSSDKDKVGQKIEKATFKKIADMVIPGFISQPASMMDTNHKGFHPTEKPIQRSPKGSDLDEFWQTIELGLPFLRKNVPKS